MKHENVFANSQVPAGEEHTASKENERRATTPLKRVGWFLLAAAVPIAFLAIQVGVMVGAAAFGAAKVQADGGDALSQVSQSINLPLVLAVAQAITIAVALPCWAKVSPMLRKLAGRGDCTVLSLKSAAGIALIGIGIQLLLGVVLMLASAAFPQAMDDYAGAMKLMGLDSFNPLTIAATVALAPVVEELLFRGLCFAFAWRATGSMWAALVLQALAFGAVHGNVVQGCYAFAIGIVLGLVYLKYRNIGACILLHVFVNGAGTLVSFIPAWVPALPYMACTLVAAAVLLVAGCLLANVFVKRGAGRREAS